MINTATNLLINPSLTASLKQKNGIHMKAADRKDMVDVAAIISSSEEWYKPFVSEKDLPEHRPGEAWIEKNYGKRDFFVAKKSDTTVGTLSMQEICGMSYLGYIYLHTDHVGNGYGGQIMNFAKQRSKMLGHEGMFLIAHPKATWAVKAYEKFGFKRILDTDKEILEWNDGCMKPYHEDGFHLYLYKHQ